MAFSFHQSFRSMASKANRFWLHLCYYMTVSAIGYLALSFSKPKASSRPNSFDVFFTSVSATTDASMATVEMEVFSDPQLIIMTVLMLLGGEIFISMIELLLRLSTFPKNQSTDSNDRLTDFTTSNSSNFDDQVELDLVSCTSYPQNETSFNSTNHIKPSTDDIIKYKSLWYLFYVVLGSFVGVHIAGSSFLILYLSLVPSARQVLVKKGLRIQTFSVFTTVSTFSNCGFVPTNENLIVFVKNSGLLWLLIPQGLLGNSFYPIFLRFVIWVLMKMTRRREFEYLLKNSREIGYDHLLSSTRSSFIAVTAFGFICVQLVLFCSLEWNSEAMDGLTSNEKFVASLFQVINSRHVGEYVFDLASISPSILVLFVAMMYLPPYTSFLPKRYREKDSKNKKKTKHKTLVESLTFSLLSYLVIFIILICIAERDKMKQDPINFNVLNIIFEVISTYGSVGFSTGYSCKRQLKHESSCKDKWFGFVGKWSIQGKSILVVVMVFGRLKKFNFNGGKAWKLS